MEKKYFKGALFGGFDRRDVLAYIEAQAKERRAETDKMAATLKEALTSSGALATQNTEAAEKISAIEEENASLRQRLEQLNQTTSLDERTINELRASSEQKDAELERLKVIISNKESELLRQGAQITEQTEQIEKLNHALSVFEAARQRVADIELAAFRRAEEIEKAAISNAEKARDTLRRLLVDAKSKYDSVKSDVDVTMLHLVKELDGTKEQLCSLGSVMDIIGERIETLGYYDSKQASHLAVQLEPLDDESVLSCELNNNDTAEPEAILEEAITETDTLTEEDIPAPEIFTGNSGVGSDMPAEKSAAESETFENNSPVREFIENPLMAHRMDKPLPDNEQKTDADSDTGELTDTSPHEDEPLEKPVFKIYKSGQ